MPLTDTRASDSPRPDPPAGGSDPDATTTRARIHERFGELSSRVAVAVGSPWAFMLAVLTILGWGISGPLFGFSDTWQLVVNTGTTIVTFLIVFLIQHTQNKEARAIQLKLNEVIAALAGASNALINVEKMSDADLDRLQDRFQRLTDRVRREGEARQAHSVEEEGTPTGQSSSA
jgi:low affinity Fe/Cu permease